jgi:hypothetical protein
MCLGFQEKVLFIHSWSISHLAGTEDRAVRMNGKPAGTILFRILKKSSVCFPLAAWHEDTDSDI